MSLAEAFDSVPFLKSLSPDARARLMPHARLKTLDRGEAAMTEGQAADEIAFLVCGRMKLVKSSEQGRQSILTLVGRGELVCASASFQYQPFCCSGMAVEEGTEVLYLPRRELARELEGSSPEALGLVTELTRRGVASCERLEQLSAHAVEQRLARLLLKLAERSGVQGISEDGIRIPIALSRQDLAELCSTTLETASRIMSRLQKAGIVRTLARGFLVTDRAALEELAG